MHTPDNERRSSLDLTPEKRRKMAREAQEFLTKRYIERGDDPRDAVTVALQYGFDVPGHADDYTPTYTETPRHDAQQSE